MIRALVVAIGLVVGLGSLGAGAYAAPIGAVAEIDRAVAFVDGTPIWESALDERLRDPSIKREAAIDILIDETLFVLLARDAGLTIDRSDIDRALEDIKQQNNLNDQKLDEALRAQGYSRESYRADLEKQLLRLRAINLVITPRVTVTDADVTKAATERKLKQPLSQQDRDTLRAELRRAELDRQTREWLRERRRTARIERRP